MLNLGNIFGKKKEETPQTETSLNNQKSQEKTFEELTYKELRSDPNNYLKQKGIGDAGLSKGDVNAFAACFQAMFSLIKKKQEEDRELQEEMKKELSTQIENWEEEKTNKNGRLQGEEEKLKVCQEEINDIAKEISEIENGNNIKYKMPKVNFIIGLLITLGVTIYLFIFYSSVTYSAFFPSDDVENLVAHALFNPTAIPDAFGESFITGLIILLLPCLFLALGYVVYMFDQKAKENNAKGFNKYKSSIALYALTFVFDFIMAKKIAENAYKAQQTLNLDATTTDDFTITMAMSDSDLWLLIFCGFVSYVIWGLVFAFTMDAYSQIGNTKELTKQLKEKRNKLIQDELSIKQIIAKLKGEIELLTNKINEKKKALTISVRYSFEDIDNFLAQYFAGWCAYFALLNVATDKITSEYHKQMENVEKWKNGIESRFKKTVYNPEKQGE